MAKAKKKSDLPDLTFDEFVKRPPELTVLTDHPLTGEEIEESFADDPFDFRYKLGPAFDILRHPGTKTPAAILISGGWGTGKTSAMKWLEYLLEKWNVKVGKGEIEKEADEKLVKVRPIWFYPWKYDNKEDVRRGLIAEVILNAMTKEATSKDIVEAFKTAAIFVGKSVLDFASATDINLGPVKVSGSCLRKIKKNFKNAVFPEKQYLQPYEQIINDWVTKSLGEDERMVIFIDDLDRCMPEIALQVLEALKLYLNIEKLIFVLGVDKEVVGRLVVEHYRKLGLVEKKEKEELSDDRERRLKAEDKARLYLSKMFQVEIELSPKEEQVRDFLDKYLAKIPYWQQRLSLEHQKLFRGLVLTLAGRNPREVKRILNSALMSGGGIQMMTVEEGTPELKFEQGLQDFFIRRILQKPQYERLTTMIDTDRGRKFLRVWSQVACKGYTKKPEQLDDVLPPYMLKERHSGKEEG
jgi:hypothetical protein